MLVASGITTRCSGGLVGGTNVASPFLPRLGGQVLEGNIFDDTCCRGWCDRQEAVISRDAFGESLQYGRLVKPPLYNLLLARPQVQNTYSRYFTSICQVRPRLL